MAGKSLKELKELITKDIEYQADSIESFKNSDNPQVKEMYNQATIRHEALKDILLYIENGSRYQFYKAE